MKKIYTLLLALAIVLPASYAQKGLNIGANGAFISPSIVNQNSWGNGHEYDYEVTFTNSFGFDVGYNFTDNFGIYSGFWFMTLGQNYSDSYDDASWERELRFKYNTIPVMFKYTGIESSVNFVAGIGILYSMMSEASQTWTKDGNAWDPTDLGKADVTDRFESSDIILNAELGARIVVIDNLYVDATLNLGYGLKDINAADWQTPDNGGVYNASHNVYGGFKIGVAYVLFGD